MLGFAPGSRSALWQDDVLRGFRRFASPGSHWWLSSRLHRPAMRLKRRMRQREALAWRRRPIRLLQAPAIWPLPMLQPSLNRSAESSPVGQVLAKRIAKRGVR